MTIRILQVLTTDGRRGAETSALMLRDELRRRGLQADAVALAPAGVATVLPVEVLGAHRLTPATLMRLRHRARSVDVIIAHGSTTLPACSIALLGTGIPFVYVNIGDLRFWAGSGLRRMRTRLLLRRPTLVAARSARSADTLQADFGVAERRIVVVPNGRPEADFPEIDDVVRARCREMWGVPNGVPVVVWVGALSTEKRPDVAVRAVARFPGAHLVMAGDGTLQTTTRELAAELMPGRVHFLGAVEDIANVYGCADLLLLTSDSEGLPGVLIEAGLSGLPCVATDVGFVGDIVEDGRTGLLAAPGDDVALGAALVKAYAERRVWGHQARLHCALNFSLTVLGDRWETIISACVSR